MDTIKDYFGDFVINDPMDQYILKEEFSSSTRLTVAITDRKVTLDLVGVEE